jgi:hypothetical protein
MMTGHFGEMKMTDNGFENLSTKNYGHDPEAPIAMTDAEAIRKCWDYAHGFIDILKNSDDEGLMSEAFSELRMPTPIMQAQLLIEAMTSPTEGYGSGISDEEKAYWCEVARYMGPGWIAKFRAVGAFMHMVDSFRVRG